jgi:hypothetical protein
MGQSTDAVLFWGYCWDEEQSAPWEPLEDDADGAEETASERYARLTGVVAPHEDYPAEGDRTPVAEAIRAKHATHWQAEGAAWKAARMVVDTHCSGECPMPYVAVEESRTLASRGSPEAIRSLEVGADWRKRLDEFCALMGITPPEGQQPQWWLVSDWN